MSVKCQSCGMPIESGPYCHHCTDDQGELSSFEERLLRMKQWTRRENPDLDDAAIERQTLEYMSTMPAWKEHPALLQRLGR
jgi:hypothetical protein